MRGKITILLYLATAFFAGIILFRLGLVPPLFGSAENADNINDVLVNLAYSYMAGLLFYLLNDYLPTKLRQQRALKLVSSKLVALYMKMDWVIAVEKQYNNCTKENVDMTLEDCSFADNHTLQDTQVFVKSYVRINSNIWRSEPVSEWYESVTSPAHNADKIKEIVAAIQANPISKDLCDDVYDLLSQVYTSEFLRSLSQNRDIMKTTNLSSIGVFNGKQNLYDFIQLTLKFRSLSFPHHEHKLVRMSQEEENDYREFLRQYEKETLAYFKNKGHCKLYLGTKMLQDATIGKAAKLGDIDQRL